MKTRTMFAAVLLLAAGSVLADPPGPPDSAQHLDRLAVLLDLDAGQKAAVKQVMDEQMKERQELWQKAKESQTRPSREEMRAQHDKMHKETIEKLRPILTDQQMTKFQALTEMQPGPGPGSRPDWQHHDKDKSQSPAQ